MILFATDKLTKLVQAKVGKDFKHLGTYHQWVVSSWINKHVGFFWNYGDIRCGGLMRSAIEEAAAKFGIRCREAGERPAHVNRNFSYCIWLPKALCESPDGPKLVEFVISYLEDGYIKFLNKNRKEPCVD